MGSVGARGVGGHWRSYIVLIPIVPRHKTEFASSDTIVSREAMHALYNLFDPSQWKMKTSCSILLTATVQSRGSSSFPVSWAPCMQICDLAHISRAASVIAHAG